MAFIRKEERGLAVVALLIAVALNALNVVKYFADFSVVTNTYHRLFVKGYHVSGFDPLTYEVLSNWNPAYNVYRHPLLAFFMYPFNQIDQGLIMLTGRNWAIVIMAVILVFCSVTSCVLLFRILREIVGVGKKTGYVLCGLLFSFAYIMLPVLAPDHFMLSMTALLLTLYVGTSHSSKEEGKDAVCAMSGWKTVGLFVLTAGISLNNGLKVFLAALLERGKRFFNLKYLLMAVILPAGLMWSFAGWEYKTFVWPREMARKKAAHKSANTQSNSFVSQSKKPSKVDQPKEVNKTTPAKKKRKGPEPIMKGQFMNWTDASTSRWDSGVENLFGEAIQLHENHLLGDVMHGRPTIVRYNMWLNYFVEAMVVGLFVVGIWFGRKRRFMWTALSFFALDMVLHVGLGFGLNEVYIMSPHYMFVIPIAIGYILSEKNNAMPLMIRKGVTVVVAMIAVWCFAWNIKLMVPYFLGI